MAAPKGRLGVRLNVPGAPECANTIPDWPQHGREWVPGVVYPLDELGIGEDAVRAWIEKHTPAEWAEELTREGPTGRKHLVGGSCPLELVNVENAAKTAKEG